MWTDEQLDQADYVAYQDAETKQPLNVGTIEMQGTAYQGPYLCVPVPPFGSLKNGGNGAVLGQHVRVPGKRFTAVPHPSSFPAMQNASDTVVHQYSNGEV